MVNSINNAYGNLQKLGIGADNRVIYRIIDSQGKDAGRMSVAYKDADTFEKSYITIMNEAPKIKEFTNKYSSSEAKTKLRTRSRVCIVSGGILGTGLPLILTKNSSISKKVISTAFGVIAGICGGLAASFALNSPPGMLKFVKATNEMSKLDIKQFMDGTTLHATRM